MIGLNFDNAMKPPATKKFSELERGTIFKFVDGSGSAYCMVTQINGSKLKGYVNLQDGWSTNDGSASNDKMVIVPTAIVPVAVQW